MARFCSSTMVSTDFLAYRNTESSPRPPQVRAYSFVRCLLNLLNKHFLINQDFGLHNDVLAIRVIKPHIQFTPFGREIASLSSVRQYRSLQSRFLHCMGHPKPLHFYSSKKCDLQTVRGVTPVRKRLSLSGIFKEHYR